MNLNHLDIAHGCQEYKRFVKQHETNGLKSSQRDKAYPEGTTAASCGFQLSWESTAWYFNYDLKVN